MFTTIERCTVAEFDDVKALLEQSLGYRVEARVWRDIALNDRWLMKLVREDQGRLGSLADRYRLKEEIYDDTPGGVSVAKGAAPGELSRLTGALRRWPRSLPSMPVVVSPLNGFGGRRSVGSVCPHPRCRTGCVNTSRPAPRGICLCVCTCRSAT